MNTKQLRNALSYNASTALAARLARRQEAGRVLEVEARPVVSGGGYWNVTPMWIAASAIATGATEFTTFGGLGSRSWTRVVTVTQAATYRQACIARTRRTARST